MNKYFFYFNIDYNKREKMKFKQQFILLSIVFSLIGCGGDSVTSKDNSIRTTPSSKPLKYTHKVINNQGIEVKGKVDEYAIKIYSDSDIKANPKNIHKGVVIKLNGKTSKVIPIEISYLNKEIMVELYNKRGKLIITSDLIQVIDVPVMIVELTI